MPSTPAQALSACVLSEAKKLLSSSLIADCAADTSLVTPLDNSGPTLISATSCYSCVCPALYVQDLVDSLNKCSPALGSGDATTTKSIGSHSIATQSRTRTIVQTDSFSCQISLDCYDVGKICEGLMRDCICKLGACKISGGWKEEVSDTDLTVFRFLWGHP